MAQYGQAAQQNKGEQALNHSGTLYVVATPIGNLQDITFRAVEVLKSVEVVAAEDTRHSAGLLNHYGIKAKLTALHEHNERVAGEKLVALLQGGQSVALISDAGTPAISPAPCWCTWRARPASGGAHPRASAAVAAVSLGLLMHSCSSVHAHKRAHRRSAGSLPCP